ncbi:MAG: alpha/beta hydrolase [Nevskia sp.]|nr:alpha/beta hydrolase [Nevskia sp.]
MNFISAGKDSSGKQVKLFYQDWGHGKPVVLIHGWPVTHAMWEYQSAELPKHGLRVIAYDRRGFGQSSKPWDGYDYDTFADDLKALLDELDLHDVTLVGFSMGGGEIARYMSRHHGARISRVALVGAVTPFLLKTADNPEGVDHSVFDGMIAGVDQDRPDFLSNFGKLFFGVGVIGTTVSEATLAWTTALALPASHRATVECIRAWSATDFRKDLAAIKVPTLIIHGDNDSTVPAPISADRVAKALPKAEYKRYKDAPHGLYVTHKEQLNRDLLAFAKG